MSSKLLMIDPQNDFCDIDGAALPVAGSDRDMHRLAAFLRAGRSALGEVIVTLDTHASVGIERPTFWETGTGAEVAPFTTIRAADVAAGSYRPREASHGDAVRAYLEALEAGGRYALMVWPVHCVLGTWGHNLHGSIAVELAAWERSHQRGAFKVLKGLNPLTEQYSAVRAEVPSPLDPATATNQALLQATLPDEGYLFVGGEALSHCVAATVADLLEPMTADERRRVILLSDCMSPVTGFGTEFFDRARELGARVLPSPTALGLLREAVGATSQ